VIHADPGAVTCVPAPGFRASDPSVVHGWSGFRSSFPSRSFGGHHAFDVVGIGDPASDQGVDQGVGGGEHGLVLSRHRCVGVLGGDRESTEGLVQRGGCRGFPDVAAGTDDLPGPRAAEVPGDAVGTVGCAGAWIFCRFVAGTRAFPAPDLPKP